MIRNKIIILLFLLPVSLCIAVFAKAQDSSKKRSIDITSTFKPVLKETPKINFNASAPAADTTRPKLAYNIPVQNLFFDYQPAELNPVALKIDSSNAWDYSNYIKAGIGTVHQPYVQAAFSFGDNKNSYFNVFADHYTSKGSLPFQKNNRTSVALTGTMRMPHNNEFDGRIGFKSEDFYFYGFRPDTLKFSKEQLLQRFQTFEGKINFRNTVPTEFGLTYNPNLYISVFGNNRDPKATEANTVLNLPLEKSFGRSTGFKLELTADLTNYRPSGSTVNSYTNNLYLIKPTVLLKTPNVFLNAGVIPSWDRKAFTMLPNIMAEVTTKDQRFTFQAGWIGYYNKGSYQRYADVNPWIALPDSLLNTRVQERYAGFKGSINEHLNYSAKVGFNIYKNMPLFVNDQGDGKTFLTIYEPSMEALQLHAEIAYTQGEEFSASAKLDFNEYTKLEREKKAWGLIPLELDAALKWRLMKDLWLRTDLFAWDGPQYRGANGAAYKGTTGFDMSSGVEFRITKQFNLWLQLNNILNNKYERWHQYQAYGFNILGGVVYSFGQKTGH
jgi:hypothetical protein